MGLFPGFIERVELFVQDFPVSAVSSYADSVAHDVRTLSQLDAFFLIQAKHLPGLDFINLRVIRSTSLKSWLWK
jgi:hypothetical protein